ncbi:MBOAT family O-acyltransferase [Cupriavidus basilensis]|uniref:MBOAT family O-acyltransferase n=1 Tax=Cupriavidus basilensis TaxID=68895 RepID=UPI0023E7BDD9|nr:MBOAT family O-acyltransferase [Cupriavidus basilensis]MDF3887404.1 MBOAT family protein [Cupriavidus basilensis]
MVFASLEFLLLFLPAFLALYFLTPAAHRNVTLLLGSWVFYGWWSPLYLALFIALTGLAWSGGMALAGMKGERSGRWLLWVLVTINLAVLGWFKYANIAAETVAAVASPLFPELARWQQVVLPIGLSFTVLQAISYLADVHGKTVQAERSPLRFATYLAMFGHLVAGPIIRYAWIAGELRRRAPTWLRFSRGARRFMTGLCMKVLIADSLAPVVDTAFPLAAPSFADAWLGCLAYALQLYFDFAGYSAMAIGLGLMLGFHFPENFRHPYLAADIQDFWRRWHISLSGWLRDYLYIPLGGNRHGGARTSLNLLVTMTLAGIWHGGDSWNYMFWGAAHGLALCIARWWPTRMPRGLSRLLTLLFVMLAWTLFRSHDLTQAAAMYAGQLGLNGFVPGDAMTLALRPTMWLAFAAGMAWIAWPAIARTLAALVARLGGATAAMAASSLLATLGFLLSCSLIASRGAIPFLYFQF